MAHKKLQRTSRVGKKYIVLPAGVQVMSNPTEGGQTQVLVKGKLGELTFDLMPGINLANENNALKLTCADSTKQVRAWHGLCRAILQNMVVGVSEGYERILHVIGTGYSAEKVGPWLKLALGYSHDILLQVPKGLTLEVESVPRTKGTKADIQNIIRLKGIDKQLIGQFAAEVRACRPPENYKGKGVRYHDETVVIKAGKAGSK